MNYENWSKISEYSDTLFILVLNVIYCSVRGKV